MKRLSIAICLLLGIARANAAAAEPPEPNGKPHTFTFGGPENSQFLLDGKPFQMIGGEMHPARIPAEYWRHRIRMAKAMGLNTIAIYIFWNNHEQHEGKYDFSTESRNLGEFLRLACEEGMWVCLRPGPYCCGEWDLGGIPTYLLRYPDVKFRTLKDARYTKAVANYYHELARIVRPNLAENGGPILIVQIENEYGSYPRRDHDYMVWLRDLWIKEGVKGPFYTADGPGAGYLKGIVLPGVAVGLDTGTNEGHFAEAHRLNPDVPVMASEVYPGWLRHWGEGNWGPSNVSGLVKFYMDTKKSFSLYMFHGGTNFGFTAGANNGGAGYEPDVTSYDYGSPLDEQGRPTPAYFALRKQLSAYLPAGQRLPDIPAEIPAMAIAEIKLERWTGLWEQLPAPKLAEQPATFESLGQNQGICIYRTTIPAGGKRHLKMANVHDYAQVFVDGALIGTLDRRRGQREIDLPKCEKEATLEILVEAMGHINFTIAMDADRKGIYGEVTLGDYSLTHWEILPLPLKSDWITSLPKTSPAAGRPGGIFKGQFALDEVADTFLDLSKWKKGVVWINGHNLGRYWSIGPQQRLYCPAPWLKKGANTVVVLDLESTEPQSLDGKPNRNMTLATQATAAEPEPVALVPRPAKVEWQKGQVQLDAETPIIYAEETAKAEAEMLASLLRSATLPPLPFAVKPMPTLAGKLGNAIVLALDPGLEAEVGKEGYRLAVLPTPIVRITAATPAGLFYGGQTLRQLLQGHAVKAQLPCCRIEDKPRFAWRGLLLDEGRHFFGKPFVKHYIDLLAAHKMNTLHWHLTEDQGWRIEIKKYPKLTEIGSWRDQTQGDGKRYGGFYTQDEIREIVAYASQRHVTIVPEIEMPGHSLGALTAYPQFSCTGGPFKVRTVWGVEEDVCCAGNDATFAFLYDVLDEVLDLFPSTFIHIGGDECPKARWKTCPKCQARIKAEGLKNEHELQSYFIRRIEDHLAAKGRRLIGWDEILEGGLPPKATVMSWRGMGGATAAAESGHDYVATPTSHCYLDYPASSLSLEKAYSFEPIPEKLAASKRAHCLGVQGNMWTEHTPTPADVDRQVWPRLCALAEVGWSPKELRNTPDFLARIDSHIARLNGLGVQISTPGKQVGAWNATQVSEDFKLFEWDVTPFLSGPGIYEVEFAYTLGKCGAAIRWAALSADGTEAVRDTHEAFAGAHNRENIYKLSLPSHTTGATIKLEASLRSDGGTDSNGVVRLKRISLKSK